MYSASRYIIKGRLPCLLLKRPYTPIAHPTKRYTQLIRTNMKYKQNKSTPSLYNTTRSIQIPQFNKPPNKYELLMQARGFLQRLKVRIKYPLMKQMRPFTINDISALVSWVFLGHTVWLILGTTSFISFGLWAANSLQFQEWIAKKLGQYITLSSEAIVTFESATPNWKDGKIRLNNVHVLCMPRAEQKKFHAGTQEPNPKVTQGNLLSGVELDEEEKTPRLQKMLTRVPWFDLKIDTIEVELDLMRLMEGKGIIKSADIKGVRGVLDNRRSGWNKEAVWDPASIRQSRIRNGFEIDQLTIEDLSVVVYMSQGFRPFPLSIIQAHLDRFRKQWLFYDLLCANSIIGSVDNSIFSLSTPQLEKSVLEHSDLEKKNNPASLKEYYPFKKYNPQGVLVGGEDQQFGLLTDEGLREQGYQRKSRLRIENISMDHLHRFGEGPPQWIKSGTMDFCADLYIPEKKQDDTTPSMSRVVLEMIKSSLPSSIVIGTGLGHGIVLGKDNDTSQEGKEPKKVIIDMDVRFKDTKGVVPMKIPNLSHLNSAMVRPLIAYINHNKTIVPIKGRIIMDLSTFNGAWTIHDSTLSRRLNENITKGFVDLVKDQQERNKRLKQIGYWSFREIIRHVVQLQQMIHGTARGFWSYLGQ